MVRIHPPNPKYDGSNHNYRKSGIEGKPGKKKCKVSNYKDSVNP